MTAREQQLEQALRRLIDAAHERFMHPGQVHDYARVAFFAALNTARAVLQSPISNLKSEISHDSR